MFFWFKKKEVVLDFFTYDEIVLENFKVKPASFHYPDWWLNLPKINKIPCQYIPEVQKRDALLNMKKCAGFTHFFKNALSVPLWCGLNITIKEDRWDWTSNDNQLKIVEHPRTQFPNFLNEFTISNLKLATPWGISNKDNLKVLMMDNFYNKKTPQMSVAPGILPAFTGYVLNINYIIHHTLQEHTVNYIPNDTMAYLVPLTDQTVRLKYHLVTEDIFYKKFGHASSSGFFDKFKVVRYVSELAKKYNSDIKNHKL